MSYKYDSVITEQNAYIIDKSVKDNDLALALAMALALYVLANAVFANRYV